MSAPLTAEQSVAADLIVGLRAQLPAQGFQLAGIEVEVGELVELDPGALRRALRELLPDVDVQVKRVAAILRCLDCGAEYPPDEYPCPVCGSGAHEVLHGNELQISRAWGAA